MFIENGTTKCLKAPEGRHVREREKREPSANGRQSTRMKSIFNAQAQQGRCI